VVVVTIGEPEEGAPTAAATTALEPAPPTLNLRLLLLPLSLHPPIAVGGSKEHESRMTNLASFPTYTPPLLRQRPLLGHSLMGASQRAGPTEHHQLVMGHC